MRKVLLTGATGFIGRHCLPLLLARDYEVHAGSTKSPLEGFLGVHWHQANLLNSEQVTALIDKIKPTHMLHLAWYATPPQHWTSQDNFCWVQASLELLKQFPKQGGERIVMVGTSFEYDLNYGYCSEELTPRNPTSLYGVCKNALQEMLRIYSEINNLSSAWGRVFTL